MLKTPNRGSWCIKVKVTLHNSWTEFTLSAGTDVQIGKFIQLFGSETCIFVSLSISVTLFTERLICFLSKYQQNKFYVTNELFYNTEKCSFLLYKLQNTF